jgi:outer membrane scaffolding protein for murein synthesis (MipA/OmpV family)
VCVAIALCTATAAAYGDDPVAPEGEAPGTPPPQTDAPAMPAPERPSEAKPAPPPASRRFNYEGAIGPVVAIGPGDTARLSTKFTPGIFIRWDHWTLTNESGFVTRRDEVDTRPGLSAELVSDEHWRASMGLRIDRGREVSDTDALKGLQDVRGTVRGRLTVTYDLGNSASAGMNTSVDLLGHGGGVLVDLSLNKTFPITPRVWWGVGVAVSAADQRYMQSYFGTSQQSTTAGAEAYRPSAGLRSTSVGISLRGELGERWIGFAGAGYSVLLGPARDSPGIQPTGWGINGGIAWRFWW